MKAIVIGGVAAGMSAASKLRRLQPEAEITVYEKGGYLSYGACGLPYYVGDFNTDPSRLIARTPEQFREMKIDCRLHHEVLQVRPAEKKIRVKDLSSGREFVDSYDRLMIAVGCNSVIPRFPGADLPAVFTLRSMEDGLLMREIAHLDAVRHVAVIGGGYIGVEVTEALVHLGKKVTMIEAGDRIMNTFEPEFSELAAQELERNGVQVMIQSPVTAIEETGNARRVRTGKGDVMCDIVVMAVGVIPATGFLRDTGIRMARNGALMVDREMRTSIEDIWANS